MIIIISKIIFALSLLAILFIISRKLSVLSRLPEGPRVGKFSFRAIFAWCKSLKKNFVSSNFFQSIIAGLEKFLRKFKILALKIDNIADKFLRKLKRNSGE